MNVSRVGIQPRVIAAIIDGVIVMILGFIARIIVPGHYLEQIASCVVGLVYFGLDVVNGATPGKQIMKLGIRLADGAAASQDQLIRRYVVKMSPHIALLGAFVLAIPYLGVLLIFLAAIYSLAYWIYSVSLVLKPQRQAYHDQFAGTAVFNVEELAAAAIAPVSAAPAAYAGVMPGSDMGAPPPPPPQFG